MHVLLRMQEILIGIFFSLKKSNANMEKMFSKDGERRALQEVK